MSNNGQVKAVSGLNVVKWLCVMAVLAVGIYGNDSYKNIYSVYERALPLLLMAGVAIFIAMQTIQGEAFARLVKESRAEIRRVVWPTRQEATQTTLIVALVVFVMALILWALDWSLNQLVSLIIG
jgi:preprotein translocase subunit SecE